MYTVLSFSPLGGRPRDPRGWRDRVSGGTLRSPEDPRSFHGVASSSKARISLPLEGNDLGDEFGDDIG
jgi:hypothetical protein